MKVKVTDTHDRLSIKVICADGELKYTTGRSGDRMSLKSANLKIQEFHLLFKQFNKFASPDETNFQRFNRAAKFLESFETLEAVIKAVR